MKLTKFDYLCMEKAIELSKISAENSESPFGAVVADGSRILAEGRNRTRSSKNPTRHAEMEAINELFKSATVIDSKQITLYTSCEPCLMCLGAAHYSGIRRIVYGVDVQDILLFGSDDPDYAVEPVAQAAGLEIDLISGVLKDKALEIIKEYSLLQGSLK